MIERQVTMLVHPGKESEFESFFQNEYAPALNRHPGCSRAKLLCEISTPNRYQLVAWFESKEAMEDWRASAEHMALSPRMRPLYSDFQFALFQVVSSNE